MKLTKLEILGYIVIVLFVSSEVFKGVFIENLLAGNVMTLFMTFALVLSTIMIIIRLSQKSDTNRSKN
ncbi:hypothetical protein BST97_13960 [Nonlabens spongiae]|uniref:Uncharacterized protein n=1 Tax=Nonlabens spongiae TaxID=331648 RepID=A0A1W6MN18_9FLAO|nr:hypothetical protein BST97_13960 [Nonlabens spongiae]